MTAEDASALIAACTPALSSPDVATQFLTTIVKLCDLKRANRVACGAGDVIPAAIAAMSTHGLVHAGIAADGCCALGWLAAGTTTNADVIVGTAGGLDVILAVMAAHPGDADVQYYACWALWILGDFASPPALARMRASSAVELLNTAKASFPKDDLFTVRFYAEKTLTVLSKSGAL